MYNLLMKVTGFPTPIFSKCELYQCHGEHSGFVQQAQRVLKFLPCGSERHLCNQHAAVPRIVKTGTSRAKDASENSILTSYNYMVICSVQFIRLLIMS